MEPDDNKYMGYRVDDLSQSLHDILDKNDNKIKQEVTSILLMPSLHTILVLMYFGLLVCVLGGISSFMWKKYDIKTKSQSKETKLENQLLGSGKYAKYINAAVAYKIYKEEMAKKELFDNDSDESDESEQDEQDDKSEQDGDETINESELIGGYHKSKKLKARNIRKQKLREQKEGYQRYKKRLEYEKQLKRYQKLKEKKQAKKALKRLRHSKKQKSNNNNFGWFKSIYDSMTNMLQPNIQQTKREKREKREKIEIKNEIKPKEEENKEETKEERKQDKKQEKKMKQNLIEQELKENKNKLENMIIKDCAELIIIDLKQYYKDNIESNEIYRKILKDIKALIKLIKSLSLKHVSCKGIIDGESKIYFKWNKECDSKLMEYIKMNGKCDVLSCSKQMIEISKKTFSVKSKKS